MTNQLRLLFLFVVISGALCTVEDYVIMSQCAHNKAIYLAAEGTVSVTDISQTQNITIVGRPDFVNNNFKIALYAKETQRYLCFNDHWKLVGMKELQDTCYFNEAIVHGYFVFRSVVDLQRRIGFTQRGRAVGPKKTVNDACYMFTKIPTDQFFHQHTHFSVPKMKSTTTKIPKIENTHNPYFINSDRGSGGGAGSVKIKPNRFKNHHRQDDTLTHNYSGSGNGNGSGSKRLKKQRNGNKHKQQRQDMQQQIRGHSFSLSNPKNSTCLNSSKQNLVLSQHNLNNNSHINRKQNSNSNNNNNNHLPQNHQVRHHHNDPNKVARRHQHDQRQKAKQRQRLKSNPPSASTATTMTVVNSTKPHFTLTTSQVGINPTSVSQQILSTTTSAKYNTLSSTIVVSKRKGRRRKSDKLHKKAGLKKKHISEETRDYSKELIDKDQTYTSFVGPNFEEEDEYINSSTDYAWVTNDIMLSSVKPLSASLPSWETWYPSSPTTVTDESSDYLLTSSATASSVTETYSDKRFSTTFESSSMTDLDKNSLSLQTSVPLPTSLFITTLMENSINETISPSITTDSGTTTITTNTSTYSQTDLWSTSLSDNIDLDTNMTDTQVTKYLDNNYATPKLEDVQPYGLNTENFMEDTNASTFSSKDKKEQSEATVTVTIIKNDNKHKSEPVMSTLKEHEEPTIDSNRIETKTTALTKVNNSNNSTYSTAATYNATETTMAIADCIYAMKATTTIANNHQLRPQENRNLSNETYLNRNHHTKFEPATTMATATTTSIKKITLRLPEISPTQSPSPTSMTTSLQLHTLVEDEPVINTAVDIAATATTFSSTKFPVLTPLTTRKTLRKSTQRLLATPFHQLTYVRNEAGDIDIDNIDNISIYPELLDNDNNEPLIKSSTSRLTMISGYLPTSATAILPESIRIAKIKINRERKRMLRLRNIGNYA